MQNLGGGGGQIRCIMGDVQVTYDATLENRGQSILTENRYLLNSGRCYPSFPTISTKFWAGRKSWSGHQTKNFFFPKRTRKVAKKRPTKPNHPNMVDPNRTPSLLIKFFSLFKHVCDTIWDRQWDAYRLASLTNWNTLREKQKKCLTKQSLILFLFFLFFFHAILNV